MEVIFPLGKTQLPPLGILPSNVNESISKSQKSKPKTQKKTTKNLVVELEALQPF
jgi:hypothetical protein